MLEVKLLADAGIVGKPNAGKSTLLAAVSGARPKVAEYPFTTIEPVLGVVRTPTDEMVLLEIPGLILGAHEGAGLGLEFLRHVERTRALIHLLDGSTADPLRDLEEVRQELEAYQAALLERPVIVVINKIDIEEVRRRLPDLQRRLEGAGYRVHAISAATGEGLDTLLKRVRELLSEAPRLDGPRVEAPPLAQPVPRNVSPRVRREDGVLVVESLQAARLVGGSDLGDRRVLLQLRSELRRLGVLRELERAGVKHGDTVRIGEVELEWD